MTSPYAPDSNVAPGLGAASGAAPSPGTDSASSSANALPAQPSSRAAGSGAPLPGGEAPLALRTLARRGMMFLAVLVVLAGWGIFTRLQAQAALERTAHHEAVLPVWVTHPQPATSSEELVLPAQLQAYTDAPIYARTSGYLKRWLVDIGTTVQAGQLLAEIDTPELDQQVVQAEADVKTAQANAELAQLTARRWNQLMQTRTVSQQDADTKQSEAIARTAALSAAEANLRRLRELQGFQRVVAPFAGVVTARAVDVGDLIDAGTGSGQAREMFHLAALHKLRVYAQVPEQDAGSLQPGSHAELRLREQPGQHFEARLMNTAQAIDPLRHTLLAQWELDNRQRQLLPGGYGEVHIRLPARPQVLRVSSNTLLFEPAGMQVAVVGPDHKVTLTTVTLGRDFGKEVEVLTGLEASQWVVVNPPDSLVSGQAVEPRVQGDGAAGKVVPGVVSGVGGAAGIPARKP